MPSPVPDLTPGQARTSAARRAMMRRAADRAATDPRQLERAVRIVAAAPTDQLADVIDRAPALTAEQVDRLRALLPETAS